MVGERSNNTKAPTVTELMAAFNEDYYAERKQRLAMEREEMRQQIRQELKDEIRREVLEELRVEAERAGSKLPFSSLIKMLQPGR